MRIHASALSYEKYSELKEKMSEVEGPSIEIKSFVVVVVIVDSLPENDHDFMDFEPFEGK